MAGLYIHIPYCKQKCHYCDFHFTVSLRTKEELLLAIHKELVLRKNEIKEPIETIYFGGGTPSLLSVYDIKKILVKIDENYSIVDNPEITLEANPDDLSKRYVTKLATTRINRLSIGVQSFFDKDLKLLNRAHSAKEAINAINYSQNVGFKNITIDLIYGIPGLTLDNWKRNLDLFLQMNLPHLSSYALTVEKKTALHHFIKNEIIPQPDDMVAKQHFTYLQKVLQAHNYGQYEISNFAKKGYIAIHNSAYWMGKKYYGFGPSAHSFTGTKRSWNIASNTKYIKAINKGILPSDNETLSTTDRYNEYIMTGLRTMWGVSYSYIKQEFGAKYYIHFNEKSAPLLEANKLKVIDLSITENALKNLVVAKAYLFVVDGLISELFYLD